MKRAKSRHLLPEIHRFVTNELGENYWFNGCGRAVMNALGEKDYDYVFFAGVTGDVFAQIYAHDRFRGDCATDYLLSDGRAEWPAFVFEQCGYDSEFVLESRLEADLEGFHARVLDQLDGNVPVISNLVIAGHDRWLVFVGYEDFGETLLFMTDNMTQPERVAASEVFCDRAARIRGWKRCGEDESRGLIFVGEKRSERPLAQIYRDAIARLPKLLTVRTPQYCFGASAFRAWADELESGRYDAMTPEVFEDQKWFLYTNYVCVLATNGSCCHDFLDRAVRLNPDMTFLKELDRVYCKMADMWEKGDDCLEAIGGGFSITLDALQDPGRRGAIIERIRLFADCADEAMRILTVNL